MKRFLFLGVLMMVGVGLSCLGCSDNEKTPVANEEREPEPDPGVTRMFDVTYRSNSDCTADRLCSQSNADIFCIGLGYEYAVDYHCDKSPHRTYCDPYRVTRRPYLARVTCWKP